MPKEQERVGIGGKRWGNTVFTPFVFRVRFKKFGNDAEI
jgi:hypothetical protein